MDPDGATGTGRALVKAVGIVQGKCAGAIGFRKVLIEMVSVDEVDAFGSPLVPFDLFTAWALAGGAITPDDYSTGQSKSQATSIFVGNALGKTHDGHTIIEVRNKIFAGDDLEVLLPSGTLLHVQMPDPLITQDKKQVTYANNSECLLIRPDLPEYSILRRIK